MAECIEFDITDVANWFLAKGPLQHKKLQKLSYYAVAWHYALLDSPLCNRDRFEAWVHGPVNRELYDKYKNWKWIPIPKVDISKIPEFDEYSEDVLDFVWESYGESSAYRLEKLTHNEDPWINARGTLRSKENSETLISVEDMKTYYGSIYETAQIV